MEPGQSLPQAQQNLPTPQMTPSSMAGSSTTPNSVRNIVSHQQQAEHQHHYQQSMVPPPAPAHLQIQVSSPVKRENTMENYNMI